MYARYCTLPTTVGIHLTQVLKLMYWGQPAAGKTFSFELCKIALNSSINLRIGCRTYFIFELSTKVC